MMSNKNFLVMLVVVAVLGVGSFLVSSNSEIKEPIDEKMKIFIEANKQPMLNDWLEVVAIPGKSREEQARGEWVKEKFTEAGMEDVKVDEIGNVIGFMKGNPGTETVVIAAHMDSVFPNDTPLKPEIKDGWIHCPGSGDDIPSVVGLIWLKKALNELKIVPAVNIVFLATVQEEVGLRGMKHYLANNPKPDMVIAIDGSVGNIVAGALGINWYKAFFTTPAGHTMRSTGKPSAVKSLAAAITEAYKFQVDQEPKIYMNLGIIGGGKVENGICEEAWVTLDMRSPSAEALAKLENDVFGAMEKAAKDTGAEFRKELIMDISAGQLPDAEKHKVVQTALGVVKDLGFNDVKVNMAGATDGNAAIAAGIPSVSIGITKSENGHSLQEKSSIDDFYKGVQQLVMIIDRLK